MMPRALATGLVTLRSLTWFKPCKIVRGRDFAMWWLRLLAALYLLLAVSACKGAMTLAHATGLGVADWMLGLAAFIAVIMLCNKIGPKRFDRWER